MKFLSSVQKVIVASLPILFLCGNAWSQTVAAGTDFGGDIEAADQFMNNLQMEEAEAAYERALASDPNNPTAYIRYSTFKRNMGEDLAAFRLLQRAEELVLNGAEVAPFPDYLNQTYAITNYRTGLDPSAAAAYFRGRVGRQPGAAAQHSHLAFSESGRGNREAAIRHLQIADQLFGDNLSAYRGSELAMAYGYLGLREDALRIYSRMQSMQEVSHSQWAAAYIAIGDYPSALEQLEAAINNPESIPGAMNVLFFIASDIFDDPVIQGPQFQALFSRMRGKE